MKTHLMIKRNWFVCLFTKYKYYMACNSKRKFYLKDNIFIDSNGIESGKRNSTEDEINRINIDIEYLKYLKFINSGDKIKMEYIEQATDKAYQAKEELNTLQTLMNDLHSKYPFFSCKNCMRTKYYKENK